MNLVKKKGEPASGSRRKRAYELDGMTPLQFPQDPLRQIETQALQDMSDEYRMLRLEQMLEKRKREVEKMRDGISEGGSLPSNQDMLSMARFMAELSPDEAQRVRSAYTFFRTMEKGGGGGMTLLPMLWNYARCDPGSSEGQMINYLKLMDTQFSKGLELAKAVTPAKADASAIEFLKVMKDLVIEGVRNPVLQAIKASQPNPGVFEQILTQPELWNRAKEIGMFGGGSNAAASQIDLEIEKLRGERQLQSTKWELELRRDELKRQSEDRRTDNLIAFMGPLAAVFGMPAAQRMRDLGQQQAATHNPTFTHPSPPGAAPPQMVNLRCSCGYQGTAPLTDPPQDAIKCPGCDKMLRVSPPEYPSREEQDE